MFTVLLLAVALISLLMLESPKSRRALRAATAHPYFMPTMACLSLVLALACKQSPLLALPFAFGTLTEGKHCAEFLLSEAEGTLSRDTISLTVAASTTMSAGTVLGKITATGKYVEYDDAASDGSEEAAAILYDNVTNDDVAPADIDAVVINAMAEVRSADLVWKDGVDEDGGLADLAGLFVKARD